MIGTHVVTRLAADGHDVSISARRAPDQASVLAGVDFVEGSYLDESIPLGVLAGFDGVVFSAGSDIRHARGVDDLEAFWIEQQARAVPAFFRRLREAGVAVAVQIGSCYHQAMPELVHTNPYVRARRDADEGARELSTPDFRVMTINPPPIVGAVPGRSLRQLAHLVRWADGDLPDVPDAAPPGRTNYMSARSLADAVAGAVDRGRSGQAYLVGDVGWSFREYFQAIFDAAGSPRRIVVVDEEHPFLPDRMITPGRGVDFAYEPSPESVELLGYRRGDVEEALAGMVAAVRADPELAS